MRSRLPASTSYNLPQTIVPPFKARLEANLKSSFDSESQQIKRKSMDMWHFILKACSKKWKKKHNKKMGIMKTAFLHPSRRTLFYRISFYLKISASSITILLYTWGMWSTKMSMHMDRGLLTPILSCCRSEWASCFAHSHLYLQSCSLSTHWQRKTFWRKGLCLSPCLHRDQQDGLLPVALLCHIHAVYVEITGHNPAKNTTYAWLYACQ